MAKAKSYEEYLNQKEQDQQKKANIDYRSFMSSLDGKNYSSVDEYSPLRSPSEQRAIERYNTSANFKYNPESKSVFDRAYQPRSYEDVKYGSLPINGNYDEWNKTAAKTPSVPGVAENASKNTKIPFLSDLVGGIANAGINIMQTSSAMNKSPNPELLLAEMEDLNKAKRVMSNEEYEVYKAERKQLTKAKEAEIAATKAQDYSELRQNVNNEFSTVNENDGVIASTAKNITSMLPGMATYAIPGVGQALGITNSYGRAFGSGIDRGLSPEDANLYGLKEAAIDQVAIPGILKGKATFGKTMVNALGSGAAEGAASEATDLLFKDQEGNRLGAKSLSEFAGNVGQQAAAGAVLGGGSYGLRKTMNKAGDIGAKQNDQVDANDVSGFNKRMFYKDDLTRPSGVKATIKGKNIPSAIDINKPKNASNANDTHFKSATLKNRELDLAYKEYDKAIAAIQNEAGHYKLTDDEILDLQDKLGIDLFGIVDKIKKLEEEQLSFVNQDQLKLKGVMGLNSDGNITRLNNVDNTVNTIKKYQQGPEAKNLVNENNFELEQPKQQPAAAPQRKYKTFRQGLSENITTAEGVNARYKNNIPAAPGVEVKPETKTNTIPDVAPKVENAAPTIELTKGKTVETPKGKGKVVNAGKSLAVVEINGKNETFKLDQVQDVKNDITGTSVEINKGEYRNEEVPGVLTNKPLADMKKDELTQLLKHLINKKEGAKASLDTASSRVQGELNIQSIEKGISTVKELIKSKNDIAETDIKDIFGGANIISTDATVAKNVNAETSIKGANNIEALQRLEEARKKGLEKGFYNRYPELLTEIDNKIQALKSGNATVVDATPKLRELIGKIGEGIGRSQQMNPLESNGKTVGDIIDQKSKPKAPSKYANHPKEIQAQLEKLDSDLQQYTDRQKSLWNYKDGSNREVINKRIKGEIMRVAAEKRKLIQGDSLELVEGGLTYKELENKKAYLKTNYQGKAVTTPDGDGKVVGNSFGKVRVEVGGTVKSYDPKEITETLKKEVKYESKVPLEKREQISFGDANFKTKEMKDVNLLRNDYGDLTKTIDEMARYGLKANGESVPGKRFVNSATGETLGQQKFVDAVIEQVQQGNTRTVKSGKNKGKGITISYAEITKAFQDILDGNANANSIRVEKVLDDMLVNGYVTNEGYEIPANKTYVEAKKLVSEIEKGDYSSFGPQKKEAPKAKTKTADVEKDGKGFTKAYHKGSYIEMGEFEKQNPYERTKYKWGDKLFYYKPEGEDHPLYTIEVLKDGDYKVINPSQEAIRSFDNVEDAKKFAKIYGDIRSKNANRSGKPPYTTSKIYPKDLEEANNVFVGKTEIPKKEPGMLTLEEEGKIRGKVRLTLPIPPSNNIHVTMASDIGSKSISYFSSKAEAEKFAKKIEGMSYDEAKEFASTYKPTTTPEAPKNRDVLKEVDKIVEGINSVKDGKEPPNTVETYKDIYIQKNKQAGKNTGQRYFALTNKGVVYGSTPAILKNKLSKGDYKQGITMPELPKSKTNVDDKVTKPKNGFLYEGKGSKIAQNYYNASTQGPNDMKLVNEKVKYYRLSEGKIDKIYNELVETYGQEAADTMRILFEEMSYPSVISKANKERLILREKETIKENITNNDTPYKNAIDYKTYKEILKSMMPEGHNVLDKIDRKELGLHKGKYSQDTLDKIEKELHYINNTIDFYFKNKNNSTGEIILKDIEYHKRDLFEIAEFEKVSKETPAAVKPEIKSKPNNIDEAKARGLVAAGNIPGIPATEKTNTTYVMTRAQADKVKELAEKNPEAQFYKAPGDAKTILMSKPGSKTVRIFKNGDENLSFTKLKLGDPISLKDLDKLNINETNRAIITTEQRKTIDEIKIDVAAKYGDEALKGLRVIEGKANDEIKIEYPVTNGRPGKLEKKIYRGGEIEADGTFKQEVSLKGDERSIFGEGHLIVEGKPYRQSNDVNVPGEKITVLPQQGETFKAEIVEDLGNNKFKVKTDDREFVVVKDKYLGTFEPEQKIIKEDNSIGAMQDPESTIPKKSRNSREPQIFLPGINTDIKGSGAKSKYKTNSTTKADFLQDAATKEALKEWSGEYSVKTNQDTLEKAAAMLKEDYNGTVNKLLKNGINSAEDTAAGMLITKDFADKKQYENLKSWVSLIRKEATDLGQAVQAFNMYKKLTPEGTLMKAQNIVHSVQKEITKADPKLTGKVYSEVDNFIKEFAKKSNITGKAMEEINTILKKFQDEAKAAGKYDLDATKKALAAAETMVKQLRNGKAKFQDVAKVEASIEKGIEKIYKKYEIPYLSKDDVKYIVEEADKIGKMPDGRNKDVQFALLKKFIAEKKPPTKLQKLQAFQRINLLLNTKTLLTRNPLGNVVMGALEDIKDIPGALIDKQFAKKTGVRTTSVVTPDRYKTRAGGAKRGWTEGWEDSKLGINTSKFDENRYDIPTAQAFRGEGGAVSKLMHKSEKAVNTALTVGDNIFKEGYYDDVVKDIKKINKGKVDEETAVELAKYIAEDKTFQNDSKLATKFKQLQQSLNFVDYQGFGLGNIILPFTKTPANILDKAIDYSPVGGIKGAVMLSQQLKRGMDIKSQKKIVDTFARSLTGSTLMGVGAILAATGVITGKGPDDDRAAKLEKQSGKLPYSFKIGNTYRTMDWMQPAAIPLMIGADAYNAASKTNAGLADAIKEGVKSGGTTLIEQSLLSGIANLFSSYETTGGMRLIDGVVSAALDSVQQAVPFGSAGRQVAQLVDHTSRTQSTPIEKIKAKIPGVSMLSQARVDTQGKEIKNNYGSTGMKYIIDTLLNPGYSAKYNPTKAAELALDIYNKTGLTKQMPRTADKTITYKDNSGKKQTITLTPAEKAKVQKIMGEETEKAFSRMNSTGDLEKKATEMQNYLTEIERQAKTKVIKDRKINYRQVYTD